MPNQNPATCQPPVAVLIAAAIDIRTTPAGDLGITTDVAMAAIRRGRVGGA